MPDVWSVPMPIMDDSVAIVSSTRDRRVWIDATRWSGTRPAIQTHSGGLIVDHAGAPIISELTSEEFAAKDSELLACDVECRLAGVEGFHLELDIPGLDELLGR